MESTESDATERARTSVSPLLRNCHRQSSGLGPKANSSAWRLAPAFLSGRPSYCSRGAPCCLAAPGPLPTSETPSASHSPTPLPQPVSPFSSGLTSSTKASAAGTHSAELLPALLSRSSDASFQGTVWPECVVTSVSPIRRLRDSLRLSPSLIFVTVLRNIALTPSGHSMKYLLRVS